MCQRRGNGVHRCGFAACQFHLVADRNAFKRGKLPRDEDGWWLRLLRREGRGGQDPDQREHDDADCRTNASPMGVYARHARIIATLMRTPVCASAGFVGPVTRKDLAAADEGAGDPHNQCVIAYRSTLIAV